MVYGLKNSDLVLAPMAGFTDASFRKLCQKHGAKLSFTEMISVNALVRRNTATLRLLKTLNENVVVQLFGHKPELFAESVKVIQEYEKNNNTEFKGIDINMGCPSTKIIKQGSGSALLARPRLIFEIIKTLVKITKKPVSCKIRTGIDSKHINAIEIAKICEKAGATMITVHGRTQKQGYTGKADWQIIKNIKDNIKIPVVANGDIKDKKSFEKCRKITNADYFMIGRASLGNPFIFEELKGNNINKNKIDAFFEYLYDAQEIGININQIKMHAQTFTKGIPNSTKIRIRLAKAQTINSIIKIMKQAEKT